MNSRSKGSRGELALARFLTDEGFDARRGQQRRGGPDSPDVICESLSCIHWESKYGDRLHIWSAMHQAIDEAGEDQFPVVAFKRVNKDTQKPGNAHDWLAVIRLSDFLAILRESEWV